MGASKDSDQLLSISGAFFFKGDYTNKFRDLSAASQNDAFASLFSPAGGALYMWSLVGWT